MIDKIQRARRVEVIARTICIFAGIEPVDSIDGSPNWWTFNKVAEEIVDGPITDALTHFNPGAFEE